MNTYAFNAWTTALSYSLSEENIERAIPRYSHKISFYTNIKQTSPRNWALFVERIHQIVNLFKKKIITTTIAVMSIIMSKRPLLPLYLIAAASYFMPTVAAYSSFGSRNDLKTAVDQYCANTFNPSTYGWVLFAFSFVKKFLYIIDFFLMLTTTMSQFFIKTNWKLGCFPSNGIQKFVPG